MLKSITSCLKVVTVCAMLVLICATGSYAASGVMIEPLRIVLKGNTRSTTATILNQSQTEPIGYAITTETLRMRKDGSLYQPKKLTKREALAQSMFAYSPRRATIAPGGSQTLRIALRKPPNLPAGEYFTYISISPIRIKKTEIKKTNNEERTTGVGMSINMLVGIRIPLILREGDTSETTTLTSMKLENGTSDKPKLTASITRQGNRSSYVGVVVYGKVDGKEVVVARNNRVVTLLPLTKRDAYIPIVEPNFHGGDVRVELTTSGGKEKTILETKNFSL